MQEDAAKRWDDSLISLGLGALVVVVSGILIYNYFSGQTPNILKNTQQVNSTSQPEASSQVVAQQSSAPASTAAPVAQTPVKNQPSQSTQPTQGTLSLPTTHTVASGESLWKIAERYYGSGYEWRRIADANKLTSSANLSVGTQIAIPRAELISAASTVKTPEPAQIAQASLKPATTVAPTATPASVAQAKPTTTPAAIAQAPQQNSEVKAPATNSEIKTYTVVKGDTLWKIAQSQCNNPYAWSSIARQNKLVNPSVIHAGNTFSFSCSI